MKNFDASALRLAVLNSEKQWDTVADAPVLGIAADFHDARAELAEHEGGNDDDPQDPGGRTSRGIIQSEYDRYRTRKGAARRDVWLADDAEVDEIYRTEYWDKMRCDDLPAGIDYTVFDFGVNSGVSRSVKLLQTQLGVEVDGVVGPQTILAAGSMSPMARINEMCDARLKFLQSLHTWGRFGGGWATRVADVRAMSLHMAAQAPATKPPISAKPAGGLFAAILGAILALFRGTPTKSAPAPAPAPPSPQQAFKTPPWMPVAVKEIGFHETGQNHGIEKYIVGGKTGGTDGEYWCADFANYCIETAGIPGTRSAMARSFSHHPNFVKLDGPAYGAIVVMWRGDPNGESGHVYFYKKETEAGIIGLGGNQKDSVCEQLQPRDRVLGYYWPKSVPLPKIGPET